MSECENHPGSSRCFYCSDHFDWFCEECGQTHLDCRHVMFMPHIPGVKLSLIHHLKEQQVTYDSLRKDSDSYTVEIEEEKAIRLLNVERVRQDFNRFIDTLKDDIEECYTKVQTNIRDRITRLEDHIKTIEQSLFDVDISIKLKTDENYSSCFERLDNMTQALQQNQSNITSDKGKSITVPDKFYLLHRFVTLLHNDYEERERSSQTDLRDVTDTSKQTLADSRDVTTDSSGLTTLQSTSSQTSLRQTADIGTDTYSLHVPQQRYYKKEIVSTEDVSVRDGGDKGWCMVIGCTTVTDGKVVVAASGNNCVKLVHLPGCRTSRDSVGGSEAGSAHTGGVDSRVLHTLKLADKLWDVTAIPPDQVAVTLPSRQEIQILDVGAQGFTWVRKIHTKGICRGITNDRGMLIVASGFKTSAHVKLITLQGETIRRIEKDGEGRQLFTDPWYTAAAGDGTFYVTDRDNHTVTRLSVTGEVLGQHKFDGLKDPLGVCVHPADGSVFVCFPGSNCVLRMTSDGREIQRFPVLIPRSVCITEDNRMVVGRLNSNELTILQLT